MTSQWGKSVRLASVAQLDSSFARTTLPAPVSSATYDAANRILSFDGFTPTYDANGNLTELDGDTYAWNVRDELVSITGPSLSASFGYDAFGRRSQKTVNGQTTHYLADGINPLQEQASAGQNWTALTMTGLGIDEIIARGDASGTYYFLPDGLGSTVALMDGTGAIHTEYTYAPFGETTRTGTVATNPFQFTGRENDNTGLYYYRARYYHPVLQRFMSEDPIGFAGGDVNLYAYVRNSPLNLFDPLGLEISFDPLGNVVGEEEGLQEPLISPADVLALGGLAGRVCGKAALGAAGQILGNEVGAIGRIGRGVARRGLGNPFKGKSPAEIDEMFKAKGFTPRGPDPVSGRGGYVNPKTERSYHIDPNNPFSELPHVDVNRLKTYRGPLEKKKYFTGE